MRFLCVSLLMAKVRQQDSVLHGYRFASRVVHSSSSSISESREARRQQHEQRSREEVEETREVA